MNVINMFNYFKKALVLGGTWQSPFAINSGHVSTGSVYYVDGNIATAGDGSTWEKAFDSLAQAMAASHDDIALSSKRNWAGRNTIYVKGDEITEDYTTMAQKTDIIGVGSNDGYKKAGINGKWVISDTVSYLGCRFYNLMFTDTGANAIFDMDTQGGIEFHDCLFDSSALTTIGVNVKDCSFLIVNKCEFSVVSATLGFATACIQVDDGDNSIYGCRITNNTMQGYAIGIDWDDTASYNCWINDNYIYSTGLTIDCESDDVLVINNRLMTAIDCDSYAIGTGFDWALNNSAGNLLMGSGVGALANEVPPIESA